jgi:hypothetical protein
MKESFFFIFHHKNHFSHFYPEDGDISFLRNIGNHEITCFHNIDVNLNRHECLTLKTVGIAPYLKAELLSTLLWGGGGGKE